MLILPNPIKTHRPYDKCRQHKSNLQESLRLQPPHGEEALFIIINACRAVIIYKKPLVKLLCRTGTSILTSPLELPGGATLLPLRLRSPPASLNAANPPRLVSARDTAPIRSNSRSNLRFFSRSSRRSRSARFDASWAEESDCWSSSIVWSKRSILSRDLERSSVRIWTDLSRRSI